MILFTKHLLRTAFVDTLPVMAGYVFLGFGFGILMQQSGFGVLWAVAMSLFIYAGSMQYVAIPLLTSSAGLLTAALTAFVVNARHLFYGISMIDTYKDSEKIKPYLIFGLTDETYSLVSQPQTPANLSRTGYCFCVTLFDHCYWVLGTLLGALVGTVLHINYEGVEFALTALFVTIFVEQWLSSKKHGPAIVGVAAATVCLLIFGKDVFLIPSVAAIAACLIMMRRTGKEENHA